MRRHLITASVDGQLDAVWEADMTRRPLLRSSAAVLAAVALPWSVATAATSAPPAAPDDFVDLAEVAPTVLHDIRYRTQHNFVGRPINGYQEPRCLLTEKAADRLAEVQQDVLAKGYTLKVYDCFRPQRAVDDFVRWAQRLEDNRMKAEFYPRVAKSSLFDDGYIAERSGHSRGSTVDLTLVELPAKQQQRWRPGDGLASCYAPVGERYPDNSIDMGTGYDCFDTMSHTADPRITERQRENRTLLLEAMESHGFTNYENEWWHYTVTDEPYPDTYFDFPVTRRSLSE